MRQSAIVYLASFIIVLPLDVIFLRTAGRLFGENARQLMLDSPTPAIFFYVIYVACTVSFINGATPADWRENAFRGAQLGLFFYASFELASMALLNHWKWAVMLPDVLWGAVITALAASAGGWVANWILIKI